MTLLDMAKNFAGEVATWVKEGVPTVSEDEFKKRADICSGCEFFDPEAFGGRGRCKQCGCSSWKLFLATSKCPVDKWGRAE